MTTATKEVRIGSVINKSNFRKLALDISKKKRNGRFERVSKVFYDRAEAHLRAWISNEVWIQPSKGVILK